MTAQPQPPADVEQVRPFADFLQEVNAGATHAELSAAMKELVGAVALIGKPGTLTLVIKVKPAGRSAESTVMVTDTVKLTLPEGDRPESIWFVDRTGNVSRDNHTQPRLPLRAHNLPPSADLETGEINERDHA